MGNIYDRHVTFLFWELRPRLAFEFMTFHVRTQTIIHTGQKLMRSIRLASALLANAERSKAFNQFANKRRLSCVSTPFLQHSSNSTTTALTTKSLFPSRYERKQAAPRPQLRYCSYQRNMCKHFGADGSGSAIDITSGREVLPTNVKPLHYHLTLEPNLETFEYTGKVVIE